MVQPCPSVISRTARILGACLDCSTSACAREPVLLGYFSSRIGMRPLRSSFLFDGHKNETQGRQLLGQRGANPPKRGPFSESPRFWDGVRHFWCAFHVENKHLEWSILKVYVTSKLFASMVQPCPSVISRTARILGACLDCSTSACAREPVLLGYFSSRIGRRPLRSSFLFDGHKNETQGRQLLDPRGANLFKRDIPRTPTARLPEGSPVI